MNENGRRSFAISVARIAIAVAGLLALAWTIRDAGAERIAEVLPRAAPWIPLAILLEALRVGADALATRFVLAERGRTIPFRVLYLAQLAAQGVMGVSPAGRSASEVVKATLLSSWISPQAAAAMGYTNQANVLISSGAFSLLCLGGVIVSAPDPMLAYATGAHFAVLSASGIGMRFLSTSPRTERLLARRWPKMGERLRLFHEASRDTSLVAPLPLLAMLFGRALQTLQFAVLAHAVGIEVTVAGAMAVQAVNLVAAATGVFVPSQVGTAELVFRLSADALRTTPAIAVSLALVARVPQLTFIAVGLIVLLLWRGRRRVGTA